MLKAFVRRFGTTPPPPPAVEDQELASARALFLEANPRCVSVRDPTLLKAGSSTEPRIRADYFVRQSGLAVAIPELFEEMQYYPHWVKRDDADLWVPLIARSALAGGGSLYDDGAWVEWCVEDTRFRIGKKESLQRYDLEYTVQVDGILVLSFFASPTNGGHGPNVYSYISALTVRPWVTKLIAFYGHLRPLIRANHLRGAVRAKQGADSR